MSLSSCSSTSKDLDYIRLELGYNSSGISGPNPIYPRSHWRTVQAFFFLLFGLSVSSLALAAVHDHQPDLPPLDDLVFKYVPQMDSGLEVAEYLIMLVSYPTVLVMVLHEHRWIILRRFFVLVGLLYLLRGITIAATVLPQANLKYPCSPKVNRTSASLLISRAVTLLSGAGMSINGKMIYCGDYIYSGHTCSLLLCCLFFTEYTPKENKIFKTVGYLMWLVSLVAVLFVSISRTHYTVDILLAYFVTTNVFRIYHTVAAHYELREPSVENYFSQTFSFGFIEHFETGMPDGRLPNKFQYPLWIYKWCRIDRI